MPKIHPTAWVAPGAFVRGDVTIDEQANIWYNAVLRGDQEPITVGKATSVQDNCVLHGDAGCNVVVGQYVTVGHGAVLHGCTVEDNCLIGMNAVVLDHAVIGAGSIVGAGAVVAAGTIVPPKSLVVGVPGKVKKTLTDEDVAGSIANAESYLGLMAKAWPTRRTRSDSPWIPLQTTLGTDHSVPVLFHGKEALVMPHSLTHPERLTITGPQGETYQGGDQEWYRTSGSAGGCGPTTAAALLSYLSQTRPRLRPMAPAGGQDPGGLSPLHGGPLALRHPRRPGAGQPESLVLGCRSFALSRGCRLQGQVLEIPAQREARPSLDQCRQFVAQCLDRDCPVAFLNFSHGALKNLDSWHWVPLTAMTEGESVLLCTILDEGEARVIDLALWWETSSLGGALVGLFPDMESDQTDS